MVEFGLFDLHVYLVSGLIAQCRKTSYHTDVTIHHTNSYEEQR